jgi:hypothetical protein
MYHIAKQLPAIVLCLPLLAFSQVPASPEDHHKLVRLDGIQVTGTRLPSDSLIKVAGLKIGQMINDDVLKGASDKLTSTGLVKGIDYGYNMMPGQPGVYLSIKVFDEDSLLPVHILPPQDAEPIWSCLRSADPIFTREMPNTEKAIHFYSVNIARCIEKSGAAKDRVAATVACDGTGKSIAIDFHVSPPDAH